jgi:hypothetical protein
VFMDKLYGPIHNYSGQDYFLYFEFKWIKKVLP